MSHGVNESNLPQNPLKQNKTNGTVVVKSTFFVRFFGRIEDTKKTFRN